MIAETETNSPQAKPEAKEGSAKTWFKPGEHARMMQLKSRESFNSNPLNFVENRIKPVSPVTPAELILSKQQIRIGKQLELLDKLFDKENRKHSPDIERLNEIIEAQTKLERSLACSKPDTSQPQSPKTKAPDSVW